MTEKLYRLKPKLWKSDYTIQDFIKEYNLRDDVDIEEQQSSMRKDMLRCIRVINKGKTTFIVLKTSNQERIEFCKFKDFKTNYPKDRYYFSIVKTEVKTVKNKTVTIQSSEIVWLFDDSKIDIFSHFNFEWIPYSEDENDPCDETCLNLFSGLEAISVSSEDYDQKKIQKILNHLLWVLANNDRTVYEYILDWLSHLVKFPRSRRPVPIFVGPEGAGKTVFFEEFLIPLVLGEKNAIMAETIDELLCEFNIQNAFKMLICIQELKAISALKNKMESFKAHTSGKYKKANEKNVTAFQVKNYLSGICNSNYYYPFPFEGKGRRWAFMEVSDKYCDDLKYHTELRKSFTKSSAKHFLRFLLDRDVQNVDVWKNPNTEIRRANLAQAGGIVGLFIRDMIEGKVPLLNSIEEGEDDTYLISKEDLYQKAFIAFNALFTETIGLDKFCREIVQYVEGYPRIKEIRVKNSRLLQISKTMWSSSEKIECCSRENLLRMKKKYQESLKITRIIENYQDGKSSNDSSEDFSDDE